MRACLLACVLASAQDVVVVSAEEGSANEDVALPGDALLRLGGVDVRGNYDAVIEQLIAHRERGQVVDAEVLRLGAAGTPRAIERRHGRPKA